MHLRPCQTFIAESLCENLPALLRQKRFLALEAYCFLLWLIVQIKS